MGSSNDKEVKEEDYIKEDNEATKFEPNNFNKLMENIDILKELDENIRFYRELNIKKELLDKISKKYLRFRGIKRFCIPIIGVISSGKSTFMNYLLKLNNILEIGEKITTQFICIIRHDENVSTPEIYEVKIEKRDTNAFNFIEKGENLLNCDGNSNEFLKEKIKKRNEDISKTRKNEDEKSEKYLDPADYFLIIKTKIPIFEGEYKKYGKLIDFLDIPGLDDGNTNFDNFVIPIFKNILFPIFIFDVYSYSNDAPKIIIKQFIVNFLKIIKSKYVIDKSKSFEIGFYILNKIDLINKENEKEDKIINNFKDIFSKIKTDSGDEISIDFNDENFIGISAKNLSETNENSKLDGIFLKISQESENSDFNSFKRFIKDFLKKNYQIDLNEAKEENENLNNELNLTNKFLKSKCEDYFDDEPKLNLKE